MSYSKDISITLSSDSDEEVKTLIDRMYGWRGYTITIKSDVYRARSITITASQFGEIQATLTVAFDGEGGLNADEGFAYELEILRLRPHFLCEFTKLANKSNDLHVIGALFHSAVIVAYKIKKASYVVIEVHPRHVQYYKRMLGFKILADPAHNKNVGASGVLLGKSLRMIARCIAEYKSSKPPAKRSMYPYFFDKQKEDEITRLLSKH